MPKKILLIHYFYKPFSSNQSFRYEQIIKSLESKDVQIDVLTSAHYSLPDIEILNTGIVHRVNSVFLKKKLYEGKRHEIKNNEIVTGKRGIKAFKNLLKKALFKVIWPDFAMLWILPAIKKGRNLNERENYDLIISGSFPFSSHVVGYFIKRKYPETRWIVDYIDPFSLIKNNENPSNNTIVYGRLNVWAERKINEIADKIILLKEAFSTFELVFPELTEKVVIAPPMLGIDRDQYELAKPYKFDLDVINIVFIGSLYKSIRNPEPILEIFSKLPKNEKRICLHFIGDLKDCGEIIRKYSCLENITVVSYGKVSKSSAMSYMKGADILLNISNDSTVQLPGKVVEYAYSGKKLINYSKTQENSSNYFFREKVSNELYFEISNSENFSSIVNLFDFINSPEPTEVFNQGIEEHFPENISKLYL